MKKLFPFLLLLLTGCKHDDAGKPVIVCSASKLNVLYIGVNNPITVVAAGIPCGKLKLKVVDSLGQIRGDSGKYIACPQRLNFKIAAYKVEDDKEIFLDTLNYKVLPIPLPIITIAGQSGECSISREELLNAKGIIPKLDNFIFDLKFPVVSFNMSVLLNGVFIDEHNSGPAITEQMKKNIALANSGGRVFIEDVHVMTPQGERKIPGISIKIK